MESMWEDPILFNFLKQFERIGINSSLYVWQNPPGKLVLGFCLLRVFFSITNSTSLLVGPVTPSLQLQRSQRVILVPLPTSHSPPRQPRCVSTVPATAVTPAASSHQLSQRNEQPQVHQITPLVQAAEGGNCECANVARGNSGKRNQTFVLQCHLLKILKKILNTNVKLFKRCSLLQMNRLKNNQAP